jgi:hypothetical protein
MKLCTEWTINCLILCHFQLLTLFNTIFRTGVVGAGAGAASRYGSDSDQMMRLLAAPAPQHWLWVCNFTFFSPENFTHCYRLYVLITEHYRIWWPIGYNNVLSRKKSSCFSYSSIFDWLKIFFAVRTKQRWFTPNYNQYKLIFLIYFCRLLCWKGTGVLLRQVQL